MEVTSRPWRGSRFTFVLPLKPPAEKTKEYAQVSGPGPACRTIEPEARAQATIFGEE